MAAGFVKVYDTILHSSVWLESNEARLVWLTMLIMADADGHVAASVGGLAHAARVGKKACREALDVLEAPDEDSRSPEHDGRRIERVDGGWFVLNHSKYRQRQTTSAERMRVWRAKKRDESRHSDARLRPEAEAEIRSRDQKQNASPPKRRQPDIAADVIGLLQDAVRSLPGAGRGPRDVKSNRDTVRRVTKREDATLEDWKAVIGAQLDSVRNDPSAWRYLCLSTISRPANWARLMDAPRGQSKGAYVPRSEEYADL